MTSRERSRWQHSIRDWMWSTCLASLTIRGRGAALENSNVLWSCFLPHILYAFFLKRHARNVHASARISIPPRKNTSDYCTAAATAMRAVTESKSNAYDTANTTKGLKPHLKLETILTATAKGKPNSLMKSKSKPKACTTHELKPKLELTRKSNVKRRCEPKP